MHKNLLSAVVAVVAVLLAPAAQAAAPKALYSFSADPGNIPSIQRGARNFVNYCAGCHGVKFLRYNRLAADLGIPEDMVEENLIFTSADINAHMLTAMPQDAAEGWFGQPPPDLSLTARSKGAAWIYSFLNTFHVDESSPTGFDNAQLHGAAMPHVLVELQGVMALVEDEHGDDHDGDDDGGHGQGGPEFEQLVPGTLSAEDYQAFTADLTNFLAYAAEPGKADRISLGWKVMFYLFLLLGVAWLLKREYWKDVH